MNPTVASSSQLRLPACLIIMDGFGQAADSPSNAISQASTPVLDELFSRCSHTFLQASGEAVGLPAGQMGNSEVGHLNIGAGRVVYQELTRINRACRDGSLRHNPVLQDAFAEASKPQAALHLMGLLSDGGVHSSNEHLYALIDAALDAGVTHIMIHCFMDGRDVAPTSGVEYMHQLIDYIETAMNRSIDGSTTIEIASVAGRYYAMDRDNRWERVQLAYEALVSAQPLSNISAVAAIEASYEEGITDEFIKPIALNDRGIIDGDSLVFFNFRPDRAREITRALTDPDFQGFSRSFVPRVSFVCLTEYDPTLKAAVAFPKEFPEEVLADVLADAGLSQYHIAETEKYAHVTFFLNGGREKPKAGEERCLIPSPKVATYDLKPEMSEPEVTEALVRAIQNNEADVYIVNYANCDMVGHTGVFEAARQAVEAVDDGVGKVLQALAEKKGFALITADHGNADCMAAQDGTPFTAHTTAPVPLVLADYSHSGMALEETEGKLSDIAPTLLSLIGLKPSKEMTGKILLKAS